MVKDFRVAIYGSTAVRGGARVSRKSSPTSILRSNCDFGVGAFRRSMLLSRRSQYLAVFAHPLESRSDRLLYSQRVLLEKRGGQLPLLPPLATPLSLIPDTLSLLGVGSGHETRGGGVGHSAQGATVANYILRSICRILRLIYRVLRVCW